MLVSAILIGLGVPLGRQKLQEDRNRRTSPHCLVTRQTDTEGSHASELEGVVHGIAVFWRLWSAI